MSKMTMEEELILKSLREFVEEEVKPRAMEIDQTNEFPRDLWDRCVELGFIGVSIPEAYGGLGMRRTMEKIVLEEIAKESPALALAIDAHHLAFRNLMFLGTEAQKEKYLPKMAFGEMIGAAAATEASGVNPSLESVEMGQITENGIILNTTKIFITNSSVADIFVLNGLLGGSYCTLIVEKDAEGVQRGGSMVEHKMGMNGSGTGTVRFTNVHVPPENICIPANFTHADSLKIAAAYLDICAISLGMSEGVFEKTRTYLLGRMRNGKPLASIQVVGHRLAEMKCKIELMRSLLYRTAEEQDEGSPDLILIHACKATIPELAADVTETAIKIHGGIGYMEDTGIARYHRDSLCNTIGEVPTDLHMDQVALQLGLPIESSALMFQQAENNEFYK